MKLRRIWKRAIEASPIARGLMDHEEQSAGDAAGESYNSRPHGRRFMKER